MFCRYCGNELIGDRIGTEEECASKPKADAFQKQKEYCGFCKEHLQSVLQCHCTPIKVPTPSPEKCDQRAPCAQPMSHDRGCDCNIRKPKDALEKCGGCGGDSSFPNAYYHKDCKPKDAEEDKSEDYVVQVEVGGEFHDISIDLEFFAKAVQPYLVRLARETK